MRCAAIIIKLDAAHASELNRLAKVLAETELNTAERAHFHTDCRVKLEV